MATNKRLAVIIGNSDYDHWKSLRNASSDAEAVRDKLQKLGFTVSLGLNKATDEILELLNDVMDAWKHEASEIVLFYAGHGVTIGKLQYQRLTFSDGQLC